MQEASGGLVLRLQEALATGTYVARGIQRSCFMVARASCDRETSPPEASCDRQITPPEASCDLQTTPRERLSLTEYITFLGSVIHPSGDQRHAPITLKDFFTVTFLRFEWRAVPGVCMRHPSLFGTRESRWKIGDSAPTCF